MLRDDALLALAVGKADPTGEQRKRERDRGHALAGKSTLNRLELAKPTVAGDERYKKISYADHGIQRLFVDVARRRRGLRGRPRGARPHRVPGRLARRRAGHTGRWVVDEHRGDREPDRLGYRVRTAGPAPRRHAADCRRPRSSVALHPLGHTMAGKADRGTRGRYVFELAADGPGRGPATPRARTPPPPAAPRSTMVADARSTTARVRPAACSLRSSPSAWRASSAAAAAPPERASETREGPSGTPARRGRLRFRRRPPPFSRRRPVRSGRTGAGARPKTQAEARRARLSSVWVGSHKPLRGYWPVCGPFAMHTDRVAGAPRP